VQFQEKVLAWTEQHLGNAQIYTASSLNNLAEAYQNQGAYAKAEPLYLRALAIFEKILGSNHPNTIKVRENLEQCRKASAIEEPTSPTSQQAENYGSK